MRTPSIYSQDDPISAALKPPPTETEAERHDRLVLEAEAKRVSEQIDDDLREERERLKKRKGDVKVCDDASLDAHILTSAPAAALGASGEREIHPAEAVPAHVQTKFH